MSTGADRGPSATAETRSGAWEEASLLGFADRPRLASSQPEHGLVWVTRGRLTVTPARGSPVELPKGTVVAYRLGESLTWAAAAGTQVRWCLRDVRVREGEVRPWTPEVRTDESGETGIVAPKRRPWMALGSLALLWIVAVTVAWCVSTTHSSRVQGRIDRLGSPEPTRSEAAIRSAFVRAGMEVLQVSSNSKRAFVWVASPKAEQADSLDAPGGALRAAAVDLKPLLAEFALASIDVQCLDPSRPGSSGKLEDSFHWEVKFRVKPDGSVERKSAPPGIQATPGTASAR